MRVSDKISAIGSPSTPVMLEVSREQTESSLDRLLSEGATVSLMRSVIISDITVFVVVGTGFFLMSPDFLLIFLFLGKYNSSILFQNKNDVSS